MKIGFALEYSLGHITHAENLKRFLAEDHTVEPVYVDIPYDATPMPALLRPVLKDNWSVRASLAARQALSPRAGELSACFFNTQVTSLFSVGLMRRVPSVVSLDATPLQYDGLGEFYRHAAGPTPLEALKKRMNERAFAAARHLVTWSQWAKNSLVCDYGVPADKVTVIPPGIDVDLWRVDRDERPAGGVAFLFVGGDFSRKGGDDLVESFRSVRAAYPDARLLIATRSLPEQYRGEPGVEAHEGLTPNSPELRALYTRADVFAFPTRGDCLPLAVMEALAAGLPVITTDVGALSEAVTDGECGFVVPAPPTGNFSAAMLRLAGDAALRRRMGQAARARAVERFCARKNYGKLIDILKEIPGFPSQPPNPRTHNC